MLWCYSLAVGLNDMFTPAEHQLVAGQWDITVTMDVTNLKLVGSEVYSLLLSRHICKQLVGCFYCHTRGVLQSSVSRFISC